MNDTNKLASNFGNALFMLAIENGTLERVRSDIEEAALASAREPKYLPLIDSPALPLADRLSLIDKAFSGVSSEVKNTLKLLSEKRLAYILPKVKDAFMKEYDSYKGIERVTAITAVPLTMEQIERLKAKLQRVTGKQIIIENSIDPGLLGGMKLRYLGRQLDGSIRSRLDAFEKSLTELSV